MTATARPLPSRALGVWMPGFLQSVTGILLFVGLTWLGSLGEPPLYTAALVFTAYGVHGFAIDQDHELSIRNREVHPSASQARRGGTRPLPAGEL